MPIPSLHNGVIISLYQKPYAAVFNFQPFATGTAVLVTTLLTALLLRVRPAHAVRVRRRDAASAPRAERRRVLHRRHGVPVQLLRHGLHARRGARRHGRVLPARQQLPRLGGVLPHGKRHVEQLPVRQSPGRGGAAAPPESRPPRRDQLVRRRRRQDDLAAEHRHRRLDGRARRPARARCCAAPSGTACCSPRSSAASRSLQAYLVPWTVP